MPSTHMLRPLTLLLACAACVGVHAADPAPAPDIRQPLTLVQLTDLALSNNPATKIAWGQIRGSQAGVELARAGYWPQLTLDYGVVRGRAAAVPGSPPPGVEKDYGPSLSLSWLLFDFGTRAGSIDAAKYSLTAARLDGDQTVQDLILTVEQDYYQVLGLQALQDADLQSVQDASASYDAATQRKNSGLATIGDVYQAEAALASARLILQTTEGQLAVARGQLAVAVGYGADTSVPLESLEKDVDAEMPAVSVHELLAKAAAARPELLAAKAEEDAAVAHLESTRGQGLPSLILSGDAARTTVEAGGQKVTSNNYTAGLTLSFPLFTGFADQAANREAQAALDVAQASSAQLQQAVQLEVWQAYQNMHTAVSTLDTARTGLKSAQQAADVAQARYKNGLDSILDVLSAQATLANARVQEVQARLNWFAAQAAMGHAVGGLDAPQDANVELP